MKRAPMTLITFGLAFLASGCILRSTEDYQRDTRSLVDTETNAVKDCLDAARAADANAAGDVVVTFNVAKKSGTIENIAIVPEKTTAPESLQTCVTDGLRSDDVSERERVIGEIVEVFNATGKL